MNDGENVEKKSQKKKNTEPNGNIYQYFKGQTENKNTPAERKKGKINASTPIEDKHKEAVTIQKTKT